MTETKRVPRRFGVARVRGSVAHCCEHFTSFLRKRTETPDLDWEMPYSTKQAQLFVTNPEDQARIVESLQSLFEVSPVTFFFSKLETGEHNPCWGSEIVAGEKHCLEKVQKLLNSNERVPEFFVVSSSNDNTFKQVCSRMKVLSPKMCTLIVEVVS